jgi:glycosyltransferase involved in cell wall biosynthesis
MESNERPTILVFADWYLPGYKAGGPIRSVANLIARLDCDFSVVTSDRDLFGTQAYPDIEVGKWTKGPKGERVLYLAPQHITSDTIQDILKAEKFDYIYLNSLFSQGFALKPLRLIKKMGLTQKTILAPRGMLKKGALSQKSFKKKIFMAIARLIGLYKGITWHATSDEEKKEIASFFPGSTIRQAPNLIDLGSREHKKIKKSKGELRLISIARISPEKNIHGAIEYLKALPENTSRSVQWDIYGTKQNEEYLRECKNMASQLSHININFKGDIEHSRISEVMNDAHFFYLPTLGENYGHAIVEALLSQTPVIISNKTPWQNLKSQRAGWELELSPSNFAPVLTECLEMDNDEFSTLVKGAGELGRAIANNEDDLRMNYKLFSR